MHQISRIEVLSARLSFAGKLYKVYEGIGLKVVLLGPEVGEREIAVTDIWASSDLAGNGFKLSQMSSPGLVLALATAGVPEEEAGALVEEIEARIPDQVFKLTKGAKP